MFLGPIFVRNAKNDSRRFLNGENRKKGKSGKCRHPRKQRQKWTFWAFKTTKLSRFSRQRLNILYTDTSASVLVHIFCFSSPKISLKFLEKKQNFLMSIFYLSNYRKNMRSSLIVTFNLHVLLKSNRFYLENCTRDGDSRAPLFFSHWENMTSL